jgi:hypothetical protein
MGLRDGAGMSDRNEIDARMHRMDQAKIRPGDKAEIFKFPHDWKRVIGKRNFKLAFSDGREVKGTGHFEGSSFVIDTTDENP